MTDAAPDPNVLSPVRPAASRTSSSGRRALLRASLGVACATSFIRAARASGLPDIQAIAANATTNSLPASLIVAGSAETGPGRWAPLLAPALESALPADGPIPLHVSAGQDGVTGANLFDAQNNGEPGAALLVSGSAMVAALAGDARVHFDYQRWLPVFLALGAPVVVGHVDLHRSLGALLRDHPVHVAVTHPTGVELPTLLALSLLSLHVIPVRGLAAAPDALAALRQRQVDVVQLSARDADANTLAELKKDGFEPIFTLASHTRSGIPDLPSAFLSLRGRLPSDPLYSACLATAMAASIETALVLPMLTPPAQAARWRHAAQLAAQDANVQSETQASAIQLVAGMDSAEPYRKVTPDLSAVLALRRWLALHSAEWRHVG